MRAATREASVIGRALSLALLCTALGSCALFRKAQPKDLEVQALQTTISAPEFGKLKIKSLFKVRNPNDFEVDVDDTEKTLRVSDRALRTETDQIKRTIAAGKELEIPLRMTVDSRDLLETLASIPQTGELEASLQLAVRSQSRKLKSDQWFAAEWRGTFLLLEQPRLRFRNLESKVLSALQADLDLSLELENPNRFAIRLQVVDVELTINGVSFGRITAKNLDRWIAADDAVQVNVTRSYRLIGEDSKLFEVLGHAKEWHVEVKGQAEFSFDSPLSPAPSAIHAEGKASP